MTDAAVCLSPNDITTVSQTGGEALCQWLMPLGRDLLLGCDVLCAAVENPGE